MSIHIFIGTHEHKSGDCIQPTCKICDETYERGHHLRPLPPPSISENNIDGLRKELRRLYEESNRLRDCLYAIGGKSK